MDDGMQPTVQRPARAGPSARGFFPGWQPTVRRGMPTALGAGAVVVGWILASSIGEVGWG
jgi:hypothetical protein